MTSGKDKIFCAGANIRMLAASAHHWKVNFCKFTNETRNGIEDASAHSGQTWIAALNGTASGGGYELALACEHILLVDDRSSSVSLPELPLLGVLPGTGGLTRVVDKRHVRRDLADYFATKAEGLAGRKAVLWRLVDEKVPRAGWDAAVAACAAEFAGRSDRPADAQGVQLTRLDKTRTDEEIGYRHVTARLDREQHAAEIVVRGPQDDPPADLAAATALGAGFWPLALARELDDLDPRPAHQRARARQLDLPHRGRRRAGAGPRRPAARASGRLVRPRGTALSQADAQAPRRHQPQPVRADRAGVLLRRLAARAGPGR